MLEKKLDQSYRHYFSNRRFAMATIMAVVLFVFSLIVNFYAGSFATTHASNYVTDVILDNIPVFNVDLPFVYGPIVVFSFAAWLCFSVPRRLPFVVNSLALFILIRSLFITLTHIGPFPDHTVIDYTSQIIEKFTFGGDLFFSGHTGQPFLLGLIFHENRRLLFFFSAAAIFFGVIVLLGHLHYSIDVVAAFFITFTIYHLARFIFKRDFKIFNEGL
jgi:hypothetical protein